MNKNDATRKIAEAVRHKNNETGIAPEYKTNALCFIKEVLKDTNVLFD